MSERNRWRDTVTDLADKAGLGLGDASYPEPTGDNAAVAYLRHLADNLAAIPVNRARHAGVVEALGTAVGDERADLESERHALDSEHEHLLMVLGRHGYTSSPSTFESRPRRSNVNRAPSA